MTLFDLFLLHVVATSKRRTYIQSIAEDVEYEEITDDYDGLN